MPELWHEIEISPAFHDLDPMDIVWHGHYVDVYKRQTQVWCGFFVLNGCIALATALWASEQAWALYNGLISYVLIGTLMGGEWLLRRHLRARHARLQA